MNNDDYLRRISAFEQASAGMKPIAEMLFTYFSNLVLCGFHRNEALQLCTNLQDKIWEIALNSNKKPEEDE